MLAVLLVLAAGSLKRLQVTYTVSDRRLTIEDGILSRSLRQTRLERVQNVRTRQTLLERLLRVGTVDFDTAGESVYDFSFHGVSDPNGIVRTVDLALGGLSRGPRHV